MLAQHSQTDVMNGFKPPSSVSAIDILAMIWDEFDSDGQGIMADDMEVVLRRVEQEQGSPLLDESGWAALRQYVDAVKGTIVSQQDLGQFMTLVQQASQPPPSTATRQAEEEAYAERLMDEFAQHPYSTTDSDTTQHHQSQPQQPHLLSPLSHRARSQPIGKALQRTAPVYLQRQRSYANDVFPENGSSDNHFLSNPDNDFQGGGLGLDAASSENSSPQLARGARGSREWNANGNDLAFALPLSPRQLSTVQYEGVGSYSKDDNNKLENGAMLMEVQADYHDLQRKLKEKERLYELRSEEHAKEDVMNQQKIEEQKRDLKTMRREISELRGTEKSQGSQIQELERQIELSERATSNQKHSVATLKKQKDELEEEKRNMQEALRQKEEELNNAVIRLTTFEADSRRITMDQENMDELREKLAAEISKNEFMARELEEMHSERVRLTALTGSLKSEVENLGGAPVDPANMTTLIAAAESVKGRSLMSELAGVGTFGEGVEVEETDVDRPYAPEKFNHWDPKHEDARRLLEESSIRSAEVSSYMKLKRSSMMDLTKKQDDDFGSQNGRSPMRAKDTLQYSLEGHNGTRPARSEQVSTSSAISVSTATTTASTANGGGIGGDDVDCDLPAEVRRIEETNYQMSQEIGHQAKIVDEIFKATELFTPQSQQQLVSGGGSSFGLGNGTAGSALPLSLMGTGRLPHRERVRRRQLQPSRAVTTEEVRALMQDGDLSGNSLARPATPARQMNKTEYKKAIANATLVSMYTIVVYLFGIITSTFWAGTTPGGLAYGRFLTFEGFQDVVAPVDMEGRPVPLRILEILVYWIQHLVWNGDAGFVPT